MCGECSGAMPCATQDICKLLHQAVLDSEHATSSPEVAREWLASEIAQLSAGPDDPLIDPLRLDSMVTRVHLPRFWRRTATQKRCSAPLFTPAIPRWDLHAG